MIFRRYRKVCEKCKGKNITERGFVGHNLRYQCDDCDHTVHEETIFI